MELLLIAVVVGVLTPGLAILALVLAFRARDRLDRLDARLAAIEAAAARRDDAPPIRREARRDESFESPAAAQPDAEPDAGAAVDPEQVLPERVEPEQPPAPEPQDAPPPAPPSPSRPGFEERLGARWAVWVGGLALALGGLFLVRFSIQQGMLGPGARVLLGLAFGLALLVAGERLRRGEARLEIPGLGPLHLPAVLTAAGAATLFGAVYAAYALYAFVGPLAAFAGLGIIATGTMLAAALHGPLLASLGLLGAFGVPILVGGSGDDAWALPPYLAAVALAAYGVARMRGWLRLAVATATLSLIWGLLPIDGPAGPAFAHLALQGALAAAFFSLLPHRAGDGAAGPLDRPAGSVFAAFAIVSALAALAAASAGVTLAWFGAAMVAILLAAASRPPVATAVASAYLTIVGVLLGWPVALEAALEPVRVLPGPLGPAPMPEAFTAFLVTATALSAAAACVAFERMARVAGLRAGPLAAYAAAFSAGPLIVLVAAWWRITGAASFVTGVPDTPFALVAVAIGLGYVAAARRLHDHGGSEARRLAAGAAACGALGALALGLTFQLDRGMLTVAFALSALGSAYVADRTGLRALRWAVGALGLLVLARIVWDPTIAGGDPGSTLVFNWLLWGYGVPALAFFLAARLLERGGRDRIVRLAESLSIIFAALLVYVQIGHALRGGDPLVTPPVHLETGLVAAAALGFTYVMLRVDARRPDVVSRVAVIAFGLASLLAAARVLTGPSNPLLTDEALLGGPLFNSLLPTYLLPAALAALVALAARGVRPRYFVAAAAVLALVLQFTWTMLAVRALWWFPQIGDWRGVAEGELWAYSAALLVCGTVFLGYGLVRRAPWLRLVGALYLLVAVLKVFIVDLAGLEGVMRAVSFIALGLVLVLVGLVYQKFLARRATDPQTN
ncbi:MAG: DUF2339 domain-containing protein [Microvirga sp.]|nr:DUF2339 domain-containing protein [Microvirga sp.]